MAEKQLSAGPVSIQGTGIQTKILLFLALTLAILTAVAGGFAYVTLQQTLVDDLEFRGRSLAELVARRAERAMTATVVAPPVSDGDSVSEGDSLADGDSVSEGDSAPAPASVQTVSLDDLIEDTAAMSDVRSVVLVDAQGAVLAPLAARGDSPGADTGLIATAPIGDGSKGSVRIELDQTRIEEAARLALTSQVGFFSAAALLLGLVGLFVINGAVRPLKQLAQMAIDLDRGEPVELATVEGSDEIGAIASSLNSTIEQLHELEETARDLSRERAAAGQLERSIAGLLEVATQLSQGDLTVRGEITSDALGAVSDAINVVAEEIGEILGDVRLAGTTVTGGSQEMIDATERIVNGAATQVRASEQVRVQVAAVTGTVHEVSGGAQVAADAALKTLEASRQGQETVTKMRDRMQRIRSEVQGISRRIKSLGDRSLEISEIVEAISGISSQTNLLALNAAIEASGAGEEGARFAVVADEVRTLAEGTAKATKRIDNLISSVQAEIQDAVVAMEEGTSEVEAGFRATNQAGERLSEIERLSRSSADSAERISRAASSQVQQVETVAEATDAIAQVAQAGESSAVEGRRIAEQVGRLAEELLENLARFRLAG